MKKTMFLLTTFLLLNETFAQQPWQHGALKVSANGRYLQHENGTPFFWLGDTGWLLFQRLGREDAVRYFKNRREKGFNVIQCIFFQFYTDKNVYGHAPYEKNDLLKPIHTPGKDTAQLAEYDYWDHVEYLIDAAAREGIYLAILPTWRDLVNKDAQLTAEKAAGFAQHLVAYYKSKPNIIWVNGGSSNADIKPAIWKAIGHTIRQTDSTHLQTFHPFGRMQSSQWFHQEDWLDLNMFASGHRSYAQDTTGKKYGEDNWRYVMDDWGKIPARPTIDGEPAYASLPHGIHDHAQPYWSASDARRYAYWSVFAGACGHVYGENTVRQLHFRGVNKAESGAKLSFFEALDEQGAFQMLYLKQLMLSRPYFDRRPDQAILEGVEGERYNRVAVTAGRNFLMAYTFNGRPFKLKMGAISGKRCKAWWYDPRTGNASVIGTFKNVGVRSFTPPGTAYAGNDWVLVLDNAAAAFTPPGKL